VRLLTTEDPLVGSKISEKSSYRQEKKQSAEDEMDLASVNCRR
jgi:hypothetical protein